MRRAILLLLAAMTACDQASKPLAGESAPEKPKESTPSASPAPVDGTSRPAGAPSDPALDPEARTLIETLRAARDAAPDDLDRAGAYAHALSANGLIEQAALEYAALARRDTARATRWLYHEARSRRQLGDLDTAHSILAGIKDHAANPAIPAILGFWLLEAGDHDAARAAFATAANLPGGVPNARVGQARMALLDGDAAGARALLEGLQRELPGDRFVQYLLGMALMRTGEDARGESFQAAGAGAMADWSRQDPWHEDTRPYWVGLRAELNHAQALVQAQRLGEAFAELAALYRKHPKELPVVVALAGVHLAQKRTEAALRLLQDALAQWPDHFAVHLNMSFALEQRGDLLRAMEAAVRASELNPGSAPAHQQVARLLLLRGSTEEAIAVLRRAVSCDTAVIDVRLLLADTLSRTGDLCGAAESLSQAAADFPHRPDVVAAAIGALAAAERLDDARRLAQRGAAAHPGHPAITAAAGALPK